MLLRSALGPATSTLVLLAGLSLSSPAATNAQTPRTFSLQGFLSDTTGAPLPDGTHSMIFRIYPVAVGGSQVWSSGRTVTTTDGYFNIVLGDHVSLDGVDFSDSLWLAEQFVGDDEMTPRTPLTSVPSAIGLVHPYKAVVNSSPPVFWLENQGLGSPARFVTNNPSSGQPTLHVMTNGSGPAVLVENSYTWLKNGYLYIGPGHELISFNSSLATPHLLLREESAGDGGGDFARLRMQNQDNGNYWDLAAGGAGNDRLNFFRNGTGDIMTLRSSGHVGIGTSNPNEMLHVAGNVEADGAISSGGAVSATGAISSGDVMSADGFMYNTDQNRTYQLPASAFDMDYHVLNDPSHSAAQWLRQDGYIHMEQGIAMVFPRTFSAPVNLPHGAVVTGIDLYYYDNSAPNWIQGDFYLKGRDITSVIPVVVVSGSLVSDGTSAFVRAAHLSNLNTSANTINNNAYQYWVEFEWNWGASVNDNTDPDIRFYGMSVSYHVGEAQ